jgi:hypothetical protein
VDVWGLLKKTKTPPPLKTTKGNMAASNRQGHVSFEDPQYREMLQSFSIFVKQQFQSVAEEIAKTQQDMSSLMKEQMVLRSDMKAEIQNLGGRIRIHHALLYTYPY